MLLYEGARNNPTKELCSNALGSRRIKLATMPDTPADVKTQCQATPAAMPPPPPTIVQGVVRNISFSPTTMMNGTSHLPTAPSICKGLSDGPATPTSASLTHQQSPLTCGTRQLTKLKRFLTTVQQFANDISPEIGERVRSLVLGLVNSTQTVEEFHSKLQEATNFPLRPFVIPFLKANLPLLQRELFHHARLAKQTPVQYLAQNEQLLLNRNNSLPLDSSEILLEVNESGKRRTPDRAKEGGLEHEPSHSEQLRKRLCVHSPVQCFSPNDRHGHQSNGLSQLAQPQLQHYRLEGMAVSHHYRDPYRQPEHKEKELRDRHRPAGQTPGVHGVQQEEEIDHRLTDGEWAAEWKHLDNLLNCIMDMVEKTRRSLTVLRRCQEADREELNHWIRRYSNVEDKKKEILVEMPRRPSQGYTQEEICRKAEEAVNEVKHQAMTELKKAVSEAERKAHEMITAERAKMEQALSEAKRQASEDAQSAINQQDDTSEASPIHTASWSREDKADEPADLPTIGRATPCSSSRSHAHCEVRQMASGTPSESCWNCGRKASETCSGCNTARYCGSFCQHKDWEKHHHVCGLNGQGPQSSSTATRSPCATSGRLLQPDVTSARPECVGDTGSVITSRCVSPSTKIPVETASH